MIWSPHVLPDFNLLITLDVLLAEGSVARAARRLRLSPSAMSRALARLRETTGDPLLVRAGRGLVPTPRALALRAQVGQLVRDAEAVLRPAELPDLARLERVFTLRAQNGFVEAFGARLLARLAEEAPDARLRFVPKTDKLSDPLRDGEIDLDIGVVGDTAGPAVRARCSATAMSAWCAPGMRWRAARSAPPATPRARTSWPRAADSNAGRSTRRWRRRA